MIRTYEEAFAALLTAEGLEEAGGGQIYKCPDGFAVRLFNQPQDDTCEIVFELNPSIEPGETWKWLALTEEAEEAFRAYLALNRL
jgi:hypothetical protein